MHEVKDARKLAMWGQKGKSYPDLSNDTLYHSEKDLEQRVIHSFLHFLFL